MLEKISSRVGKVILTTTSIGLLHCAPQHARRESSVQQDYDTYPTYQRDIAEHNIKAILGAVCEESSVDSQGFSCEQTACIEYNRAGGYSCVKERNIDLYRSWPSYDVFQDRICFVESDRGHEHLYSDPNQCRMFVNSDEQQSDLRRAIFVYLGEREMGK